MKLAPITLFTYNRPWHTRQTVEALQKNELAKQSDLIIFSDAPKNSLASESVQEVRDYLHTVDGFKSIKIVERTENWGLAKSIITGVTDVVNEHGRVIVLEDDLVTSPYFLRFMNTSLDLYQYDKQVASIHGYIYPISGLPSSFFIKGADCWGWATWKDKWSVFEQDGKVLLQEIIENNLQSEFDFNNTYPYAKMLKEQIAGKNNSWAIRWYASAFLQNMLTLYPGESYVQNIGHDSQATHTKQATTAYDVTLSKSDDFNKVEVIEDIKAREKIETFFLAQKKSVFQKIIRLIFRKTE